MGNELYFIKVGKTKYVNDLTKQGILHLSLAEEFRNRKKYGGKKYDSEEGSLPLSYKFLVDMGDNNFQNPDTILDLSNAKVKGNECIYCFKAISQQQIKNGCALLPYDFFSNLIETNDWGKYSLLLIKNTAEFLDCVERATQKYNYSYLFKPVLYDDHFLIFHIRCLAENMQSKHIFTSGKNLKNNQNTEFYSKITNMKL